MTAIRLSMDDLRTVTRFAARNADVLLPRFLALHPSDTRPRDALDAAWLFGDGGPRVAALRTTAAAAHRAAAKATDPVAALAARACGDAAAAAFLHPLAAPEQVRHILGSAACAVRIAELDGTGLDEAVAVVRGEVRSELVDVLRRYPTAPEGTSPLARALATLDAALRTPIRRAPPR